jgi:cytochrome c
MKKFVIASVAAAALSTVAMAGVNGKACAACHGANWEKHAMGKSKIVKDLTHAEIAEALKGYKAGTFGGPMKGVMKGQVAKYSDAELEAFAQTIGK